MIRFVYADQLDTYPRLRDSMFRDRAEQFKTRLQWDVTVDADGFERDAYDAENPIYVIYELPDGTHGGSMRILPTTGPTMINDHFLHLTDGVAIQSPFIWECTRFCLSPKADGRVAGALMLAGAEFGLSSGLSHSVGVFDARMTLVYRRLGWIPEILGQEGEGRSAVAVGLWSMDADLRERLSARSGISREVSAHWYERAFGPSLAA
ncbi:autoinducer synthetase [Dinoroseobacter shibae DFL 12 = DSM 16493]|jgi:acyl homoserine lactone synthase|uniref:Acyl-homoserine-lactone synthase n=1 Tax=Dinoroseobacter shibae (strain DSM 16493 / NCIMB 14021 / DFL 12) TaxID=398580 RepID=A8LJI1_DINSH|nr:MULTISPECIES: acyl-homoserine-lactone synthase [Dinoroseobacter]ABV94584.1 autoinducer synthetase [Dinoroseobacter shibae DFL 12 = DSM 16493]MDD9716974.1 acyl-homoserine-lactone synthase [Dinoroseobacter sp. PD6]URF46010.1 autoinducer synthase [Dinoroseobacter shibae]URF50316.1 autoinducer synthase [Dinoroseobacter shibae]